MQKFLVFTADWCKPCNYLKESLSTLTKLFPELEVEYLDIARYQDLVNKYAIRAVPTIIRLEEDVEVARKVGENDFNELNLFFNGDVNVR